MKYLVFYEYEKRFERPMAGQHFHSVDGLFQDTYKDAFEIVTTNGKDRTVIETEMPIVDTSSIESIEKRIMEETGYISVRVVGLTRLA